MKAANGWSAALLMAAAWLPAHAQPYRLSASTQAAASSVAPDADNNQSLSFFITDPRALLPQTLDVSARVGTGGQARASVAGEIGVLRAFTSANYPSGPGIAGLSNAYASITFMDTIAVSGAGLALGAPVSYRIDFAISGHISPFPSGYTPPTNAFATALARLQDNTTGQQAELQWNPRYMSSGVYSLTLNTAVGRELSFTGNLALSAQANSSTPPDLPHGATADFMNTAYFKLAPSVAGLNTVGMSGHDFLASAVPEPATWASLLAGLGLLAGLRRRAALPVTDHTSRPSS